MKTITRTRVLGGSIIVTIPSNIIKEERIAEDELVEIDIKKMKKDFFGALRGIGSFKIEDELKEQIGE